MGGLLALELIDGPLRMVVVVLVIVLAVVVAAVRPRRAWRMAIALVAAGGLAYLLAKVLEANGAFDGPLPGRAAEWGAAAVGFAAAGVVAIVERRWWRRVLGALLVVTALLAGGLEVNASYGVDHDLAALLGVQTVPVAPLPAFTPPAASRADPAALYADWTPPSGMPAKGRVSALSGDERIPSPGFAARDGALYLPPAALVADPPPLPLLVFMMGQPGSPDPTALAAALDAFAAAHRGLAPIAIIADQLGTPDADPACHDSTAYGAVSTYFNTEIPAFAAQHLDIVEDHRYWIIGGYSNGGACAYAWAAQHPEIWGGLLDVSGNEYPGSEHVDATIAKAFGGDRSAFEASKPSAQLAAHPGAYAHHPAVFTWGTADSVFGPGQRSNATAAAAAGFDVRTDAIAGAGHVGTALGSGLAFGVAALGSPLGLAPANG